MIYFDFLSAKITSAKKFWEQITKRDLIEFVRELKDMGKIAPTMVNSEFLAFTNQTEVAVLQIPKSMSRD